MNKEIFELYKNPGIQSRRGCWKPGDAFTIAGNSILYVTEETIVPECAVWLARTIDDSSEEARERSLLGMLVEWKVRIDPDMATECVYKEDRDGFCKAVREADTPTEAILKALAKQWEVEI